MRTGSRWLGRVLVLSVSLILVAMVQARQQQTGGAAISIDNDDIGGVVTSDRPEAGVWVIAETTDLPTAYRKIVVTDDEGRYVVPDLPDASYEVWVRGYGLVDSPRVQAAPGETLNLTAVVAPDPGAAAEILSGQLLVLPPGAALRERVHARGTGDERHRTGDIELSGVPGTNPNDLVRPVPSAGQQGHA